jgi:hypothetical protein
MDAKNLQVEDLVVAIDAKDARIKELTIALDAALTYGSYLLGRTMTLPDYPSPADRRAVRRFEHAAVKSGAQIYSEPDVRRPKGQVYCFDHAELYCVLCGNY